MRKHVLMSILMGALMASTASGIATAKDAGKSDCKNGGWQDLVKANGQPFAGQGECVSYVANGGTAMSPQPQLFAVAYTNVDGIAGYDPATDRLIAKLVDTNRDGVPNAGDTVRTYAFPMDFTTTGPVAYATLTTFTIRSTQRPIIGVLDAYLGDGNVFRWATADSSLGEFYREDFYYDGINSRFTYLEDGGVYYGLRIRPDSPSATGASVDVNSSSGTGDAPFLDVWIYP